MYVFIQIVDPCKATQSQNLGSSRVICPNHQSGSNTYTRTYTQWTTGDRTNYTGWTWLSGSCYTPAPDPAPDTWCGWWCDYVPPTDTYSPPADTGSASAPADTGTASASADTPSSPSYPDYPDWCCGGDTSGGGDGGAAGSGGCGGDGGGCGGE